MPDKKVTAEEARALIHQKRFVGLGSDRLLIPVPGTTRWVKVWDNGRNGMVIHISRLADVSPSNALSAWGDHCLEELRLAINSSDDELGPPHTATREECESFLHHLSWHIPTMTGGGKLDIYQGKQSSSWYDELLDCLPPVLHSLTADRGVSWVILSEGRVSARAVVAFMAALHQEGLSVKPGGAGCEVRTPGGEVDVSLEFTNVVGDVTTLDTARRINSGLLYKPSFQEAPDGDHHYEAMRTRQIEFDFNKALVEGEAETFRGRLVLLGRAGVGKTSVKNALLGQEFSSDHNITDLLDIQYATIDDEGTWQLLDEPAMRKHDEHYHVALAMQQKKRLSASKGSEPHAAVNQDEGHMAGSAELEGQKVATSKRGKTGGLGFIQDIVKLFQPKGHKQQKPEVIEDPPMVRELEAEQAAVIKTQEELPAEVERLVQKGKKLERKDSMFVWDFAGQLVYYTVHQLFLTERTIFLLVTDGSNDLEAPIPPEYAQSSDHYLKTEKDYVEYFLKTGSIWGSSEKADSETQRPCQPPHAYILLNKADLASPEKLKQRLELVRKLVKETPAFDDMVRKVLPFTSNPAPDNEGGPQLTSYEESCSTLKNCFQKVKQDFVDKLPIKWLRLRNKLQEKPHTTFKDAVKMAKTLQIEADKVKSVLQYFHQHRELVYWDTEGCNHFVICQPNWLIIEMRKIITVKEDQLDGSPEITSLVDLLNDNKILNESLAKELWKENHKVLIEIMQKYLLLLPWTKDKFGRHQYLVPCLLKPMKDSDRITGREEIPSVYFFLPDKVIPVGLTSRLITLLATEKGWRDGDELPKIFFNGGRFILNDKDTHIDISLEEKVWEPLRERTCPRRMQAVIEVQAKVVSKISPEALENTSRCLNRARLTIAEGITKILSMINISDKVQTAAESECQHKLLRLDKMSKEEVCNVCRKAYSLSTHGCWYGEKMTIERQDMTDGNCANTVSDVGNSSSSVQYNLQNLCPREQIEKCEFVLDEETLERRLDQVNPKLLLHIDVSPGLIAVLKFYGSLNERTKQTLELPTMINMDKVGELVKYIKCDTCRRFLPLLHALMATHQEAAIGVFDTKEIKACLSLENKESSLLDNLSSMKKAE